MAAWTEEQINADYWDSCARNEGVTVENWKLLERIRAELSNQEGVISKNVFDRGDWLDESTRELVKEIVAQQESSNEILSNGIRAIKKQITDLDEFYSVRVVEIGDKIRFLPTVAQKALETSILAGAGWIIAVLLTAYIWVR